MERIDPRTSLLELPLSEMLRPQIALPLAHVMKVYTVGGFLRAWEQPAVQRQIESLFDSAEQARNAAATCFAMVGLGQAAVLPPVIAWWREDDVERPAGAR